MKDEGCWSFYFLTPDHFGSFIFVPIFLVMFVFVSLESLRSNPFDILRMKKKKGEKENE